MSTLSATGIYGAAYRLIDVSFAPVGALLAAYEVLARRVAARPERMVITHGEPHSANVLRMPAGYVLVDWDTVLLAPPERDLWALAESDPAIPAAYSAATGTAVDPDAMMLYRLWYDLAEIAGYICTFRAPHDHEDSDLGHALTPGWRRADGRDRRLAAAARRNRRR